MFFFETIQFLFRRFRSRRTVDRLQLQSHVLTFFVVDVFQTVADQMHNAQLNLRFRKYRLDRFRKPLQSVHADDKHILHSPIAQLRHHRQPEFRPFRVGHPQAQHVFDSIQAHPQHHVNGAIFDSSLVTHLHKQCIQVQDRIDTLQRPVLPFLHFFDHRVGHLRYQRGADLDSVDVLQVALDFSRRHPTRVHRQDLVIETAEAPLVFAHDLGLKLALPIARNLDLHLTKIAFECFSAPSVAGVAAAAALRIVLVVA